MMWIQRNLVAVVDDDPDVRELAVGTLMQFGLRGELLASGEGFVEAAPMCGASCLLVDGQPGGMSGISPSSASLRAGVPPLAHVWRDSIRDDYPRLPTRRSAARDAPTDRHNSI